MFKYKLSVKILEHKEGSIFIPKDMLENQHPIHKISFGTEITACNVLPHSKLAEIFISKDIWNKLMIPYESTLHLLLHEDTIYLGPLVGIFSAGFTGSLLRPIGDRSLFFAKLLSTEKDVGAISFLFGGNHIDWENGVISGYFHTKDGWKQLNVPFPNVVYDRLPNRKTEQQEVLQDIKKRLKNEYLIPWFNPGFFNKWDIHQLVLKDETLKGHLPETYLNPTEEDIKSLIDSFGKVYIKPANGSLGLGIQQIIYSQDEDAYYCRFREDEKNQLRRFTSFDQLVNTQFTEFPLQGFIAQQGISLIRINHKPVDFRVHTNKNEYGEWEMSACAAKIAGSGSVTTHLKSGGEVKVIDEIIDYLPYPTIEKAIKEATVKLSEYLDVKMDGLIGEIGFDIGVDQSGAIWLFEANSKPGRSIFSHPQLKAKGAFVRRLPMSYAIYLTEKAIRHPEELLK